ncbi:hypothetical protein [Nannocystis pusilla]|uniref:hypothetical protein n=1 Tax=Nannocystis pusilla TaxID=889268 RepID=UPI003B82491B
MTLAQADVRDTSLPAVDLIVAMNFSYCISKPARSCAATSPPRARTWSTTACSRSRSTAAPRRWSSSATNASCAAA